MEIVRFGDRLQPFGVALGFFDAVHIGHRRIISEVISYAKSNNLKSAVFTFDNNFFEVINRDDKPIHSLEQRLEIFRAIGLDYVVLAHFDRNFMCMEAENFLHCLIDSGAKMIACGEDYRFGSCGKGNADMLRGLSNVAVHIERDVLVDGVKVSSTLIRSLLDSGKILEANRLMRGEND